MDIAGWEVALADGRLAWRPTRHSGVSWIPLAGPKRGEAPGEDVAALIRMEPGCGYPPHRHVGAEDVLVLQGGYRDELGEHRAGTHLRYPAGSTHSPVALGDRSRPITVDHPACVLFSVARGGVENVEDTLDLYLDYNASTPIHPSVRAVCAELLGADFANPSAAHAEGKRVRARIDRARATVAASIGARPEQIFVTSGGTEANNWALFGVEPRDGRGHWIVSAFEHKSILAAAAHLEARGHAVTRLGIDAGGRVRVDELARALRADTRLVSVMLANNETGVLQPIEAVAELCERQNVPLHVDAVCALGRVPIDVDVLRCDLLTLGSHKLYAPKGCGILYAREPAKLTPLIHGCGQQSGMRGGTENALPLLAFARALELLRDGELPNPAALEALRDRLWARIREVAPDARRNGAGPSLCNTLNVCFPGRRAWELVDLLAQQGISVSPSASSPSAEPSHVLRAMGLSPEDAAASLRFSMGAGTSERTIEHVARVLADVFGASAPPISSPSERAPIAGAASNPGARSVR